MASLSSRASVGRNATGVPALRALQREALRSAAGHRRAFLRARAAAGAVEARTAAVRAEAKARLAEALRLEAEAEDEESGAVVADGMAIE